MMQGLKEMVKRGVLICLLIGTGCTNVSFQERMARQAQCVPPSYLTMPSLNPSEENYEQIDVDEPIQEVTNYYFDLLMPVDANDSFLYNTNGLWRVQEFDWENNSGKLLDCQDVINRFTVETGCIFLYDKDTQQTIVEYSWHLSEVGAGCLSLLE